MSPNDYLKALRMNKAAELIQGGTHVFPRLRHRLDSLPPLILPSVSRHNMEFS